MSEKLLKRIEEAGPKRILAIDGGGLRGVLALQYLQKIQDLLSTRYDRKDFVLSDYFDLIGGTSTGAIIATGLALGMRVEKILEIYLDDAKRIFPKSIFRVASTWPRRALNGLVWPKYPASSFEKVLKKHFGNRRFDDDDFKSVLAVITKRFDTSSPWILVNSPKYAFYNAADDGGFPNREYLLRDLIRASTAAPTVFKPKELPVARNETGWFVDGGLSTFNNPALAMLMVAHIQGYGLGWKVSKENLFMVSVGTGLREIQLSGADMRKLSPARLGARSLFGVLDDGDMLGQSVMQWISESQKIFEIDRLMGNIGEEYLFGEGAFVYARYNARLKQSYLRDRLDLDWDVDRIERLASWDDRKIMNDCMIIGQKSADILVESDDFPNGFDIAPPVT